MFIPDSRVCPWNKFEEKAQCEYVESDSEWKQLYIKLLLGHFQIEKNWFSVSLYYYVCFNPVNNIWWHLTTLPVYCLNVIIKHWFYYICRLVSAWIFAQTLGIQNYL